MVTYILIFILKIDTQWWFQGLIPNGAAQHIPIWILSWFGEGEGGLLLSGHNGQVSNLLFSGSDALLQHFQIKQCCIYASSPYIYIYLTYTTNMLCYYFFSIFLLKTKYQDSIKKKRICWSMKNHKQIIISSVLSLLRTVSNIDIKYF